MQVRKATEKEYSDLAQIYKKVFPVHNRFSKPLRTVVSSLKKEAKKHELFVAVEEDRVVGGLVLIKADEDVKAGHIRWKLRHIAIHPEFQHRAYGESLVKYAEMKIRSKSKTAKIELHVSENEKDALTFYERLHYKKEGELYNHYRYGEKTYVLGKTILREE